MTARIVNKLDKSWFFSKFRGLIVEVILQSYKKIQN